MSDAEDAIVAYAIYNALSDDDYEEEESSHSTYDDDDDPGGLANDADIPPEANIFTHIEAVLDCLSRL